MSNDSPGACSGCVRGLHLRVRGQATKICPRGNLESRVLSQSSRGPHPNYNITASLNYCFSPNGPEHNYIVEHFRFTVRAGLRPNWAWCCIPEKGPIFSQHWCIVAYVHSTLTSHHRQKGLARKTTRPIGFTEHGYIRLNDFDYSNIKLSNSTVCFRKISRVYNWSKYWDYSPLSHSRRPSPIMSPRLQQL